MKRVSDNVDNDYNKKRDSDLLLGLDDRENELSRKFNCQEVNSENNEKQNVIHDNEISKLCDSKVSIVNINNAPKSNDGYSGKLTINYSSLVLAIKQFCINMKLS